MSAYVAEPAEEGNFSRGMLTPEWWKACQALTLEQQGFALAVLVAMHKRSLRDVFAFTANADALGEALNSRPDTAKRLRNCFVRIPTAAVREQLQAIATWPHWLIQELAP